MANQHDGNGSGNGNGYKYEPLLDGKAIRLLNLYPGSIDETIRCSLTVTEIDSGYLQYEAISYAWGSPVRSRSIVCNSQALKITESLFTALQRFRFDHHVRALWADAICIDQENTAERSSQINLMGQIYRNASKVLVWLGHEEDAVVQTALSGICGYLRSVQPSNLEHEHPSYLWHESIVKQPAEDSPLIALEDGGIAGLSQICSCTWFGRGWVVQESALARVVHLHWGNARINFDWIGQTINYVPKHIFHLENVRRCYSIYHIRETQQNPQTMTSFHQLLVICRYFEFTDLRDRIYGLLGLRATDSTPGEDTSFIVPNYGASVMECYQKVTEKILIEQHDWRVLTRIRHQSELSPDQPSWVLQWNESRFYRQRRCAAPLLASSRNIEASKERFENHICICIDGFTIDTVGQLHPLSESPDFVQEFRNRQKLLRDLSTTQDVDCLARTFGEPFDSSDGGTTPTWIDNFHAFMQINPTEDDLSSPRMNEEDSTKAMQYNMADDFWEDMEGNTSDQTIFTTEKGTLGIGSKILQSGDVIVFFLGAPVPFVLRRVGDLWRFIGDCYMYDFTRCQDIISWSDSGDASKHYRIY